MLHRRHLLRPPPPLDSSPRLVDDPVFAWRLVTGRPSPPSRGSSRRRSIPSASPTPTEALGCEALLKTRQNVPGETGMRSDGLVSVEVIATVT